MNTENLSNENETEALNKHDGYVMRFNVEPKQAIDNLMKYLRQETITEKITS